MNTSFHSNTEDNILKDNLNYSLAPDNAVFKKTKIGKLKNDATYFN